MTATACTNTEGGSPIASGDGGQTTTTKSTTRPPRTTSSSAPETAIKPCELISSSAASTLGITSGPQQKKAGDSPYCEWRVDKDSIADSYTLGIGVLDGVGLDDIVSSVPVQRVKVGSRNAAQSIGGVHGVACVISLELTSKSRIDVAAVGGDPTKLCKPALDAANVVEPELP
ncbi:DUF3558 family protein [Actinokineospora inagensis]|uniref:DUF3558 family protein n=1 Tax=Actinokineospora inagensis TaxID=103730 RepID=UPI00146F9D18|nr:DUF3558 family protein [Actinokineospora inagensis]